jgi:hypothetical protein
VMHVLLQIFQRNFRFFHAFNCKIANRLFKIESTFAFSKTMISRGTNPF